MVLVLDVSNTISPTFVEQLTLSATILNFSSTSPHFQDDTLRVLMRQAPISN